MEPVVGRQPAFLCQNVCESQKYFVLLQHMRRLWLLTVLLSAISASAQSQKIGDFIESTSYNLDKIGVERHSSISPVMEVLSVKMALIVIHVPFMVLIPTGDWKPLIVLSLRWSKKTITGISDLCLRKKV